MNEGVCIGDAAHPTCGPGQQMQTRICTDGSNANIFPAERCTGNEKIRTVSCDFSGTQLPNCPTEGISKIDFSTIFNYYILLVIPIRQRLLTEYLILRRAL